MFLKNEDLASVIINRHIFIFNINFLLIEKNISKLDI